MIQASWLLLYSIIYVLLSDFLASILWSALVTSDFGFFYNLMEMINDDQYEYFNAKYDTCAKE